MKGGFILGMQENSEFVVNRLLFWNQLKELKPAIIKIAKEGIETQSEEKIARAVCNFILSDMEYEESPESITQRKAGLN